MIVVDDGSTNGTPAVVARWQQQRAVHRRAQPRDCYQANAGPVAARNRGVALANGSLLAFLDADDLWLPGKLTSQMEHLHTHTPVDMVLGQVEQFISSELASAQRPTAPTQRIMVGLHVRAMLIRRASFARVGAFATTWTIGEFIEWYGRAQTLGLQAAILPQVVMPRRLHTTNLTRRTQDQRGDYLKILKARLDEKRRRAVGAPTYG